MTNSLVAVSEALFTLIQTNAVALGIEAVYYGDQSKLPVTPAVCIEPTSKSNTLRNAARGIGIIFDIDVLVYHSAVTSTAVNRKDADTLAEAIETLIHTSPQLGGLLIHCYVKDIVSGYATKADSLVRAAKLSFTGESTDRLPS